MATGDQSRAPREADCDFNIFTTPPTDPYVELGVVEFTEPNGGGARSLQRAKQVAAPHVCKAGGNGLLVWTSDARGQIPKATVVFIERAAP